MQPQEWTPEQLEQFARERLTEDGGFRPADGERVPAPVPAGPNPIDENDQRLAAGQ